MSSSESSLVTTAASDTSSSADSRYCSSGSRANSRAREATSNSRRRSYSLKARGVVITKGDQKVLCVCKGCKGQRLVSKSTCYRHLRIEADHQEVHVEQRRITHPAFAPHLRALRLYSLMHLAAGVRLGF